MPIVRRASVRFGLWVVVFAGVATATVFAHLGAWVIGGVMFGAWICVAFVEIAVSRRPAGLRPGPPHPAAATAPELEHVRVLRTEPEAPPEPVSEPEWVAAAAREPERRPEPEPQPEPEPEAAAEPEPEPEPEPEVVRVPVAVGGPAQQWNLWSLEQLVRDQVGDEPSPQDEERAYLLMYLREFASPDGLLPADFDSLVRETFGDLIAAGETR